MNKQKKLLIALVFIINTAYLTIRFFSIPLHCGLPSFILGTLLFCAELIGFFSFITYVYIFTGSRRINEEKADILNTNLPTVDVFICTYNEDIPILEKTILAAKNLQYPKDKLAIYVLDDGNRTSLKHLCTNSYKVNYIARKEAIHAKAGNINNALIQTHGELFTVLDSDMICKPNYLLETVRIF